MSKELNHKQQSNGGKSYRCSNCTKKACPFAACSSSIQERMCPIIRKNEEEIITHDEFQKELNRFLERHCN
ncbi:MAG: hypothetical protein WKF97_13870 [Chitinophagaceae bacterium]